MPVCWLCESVVSFYRHIGSNHIIGVHLAVRGDIVSGKCFVVIASLLNLIVRMTTGTAFRIFSGRNSLEWFVSLSNIELNQVAPSLLRRPPFAY